MHYSKLNNFSVYLVFYTLVFYPLLMFLSVLLETDTPLAPQVNEDVWEIIKPNPFFQLLASTFQPGFWMAQCCFGSPRKPGHPELLAGTLFGTTRSQPRATDCTGQALLCFGLWFKWWWMCVWFHTAKLQDWSVHFHLPLTIFHNPWATLFIFTILDWKMA